ncbi:8195_t:CDS:2 [Funneliformis geosporum]|uniref:8195_t:CDS:1 n=1 Tax=Funneliformis geosporum TaxID=1117311 RepID=A0A9W4SK66_9GLOM|nr:8195_t:CDS:2 [Funneliformis geosporum]
MSKPRFFTGLQPTGTLTLGNYCGAIQPILALQEDYEVIIMIADLHALTVPKKDFDYSQKSQEIVALLYACAPFVTISELNNMIQYKEKKKEQETGNLALLAYPVLQAADIFLYDSDLIIVGQDQKQHLELATDIAQKFNNFYEKELLKIPEFTIPNLGAKIMGLKDPTKKMSKSENDYIGLLEASEVVKEKFKKAKTDKIREVEKEMNKLNYSQFKEKVAEIVNEKLTLIQKNYNIYLPKISEILKKNNEYLKSLAEKKITIIKRELKLNYGKS